MKKIVLTDNGFYWQSQIPVSIDQIKNRRTRLTRLIEDTKMKQTDIARELASYEKELASLSTPEIDNAIIILERKKNEAIKRAEDFLEECIGKTNYDELQQKGKLVFQAKDSLTYRISDGGTVYRKDDAGWKRICLIRPQGLPLPDFVLAALINVREHPGKYVLRRR